GLLALDARCQARIGNHGGAARSLRAIRRLSDHLDSAPSFIITAHVAAGMRETPYDVFQLILAWDTPTKAADIAAYRNAFPELPNPFHHYATLLKADQCAMLYHI